MKKITLIFSVLSIFAFLSSCSWKVPESVSVKTNAEYNFTIGSANVDLSKKMSAKRISEEIKKANSNSDFSLTIYDYKPNNRTEGYRKLLGAMTLKEIPLDISEIIPEDMDFENSVGEKLENLIERQEIKTPDVSSSIGENKISINLGDFSKEIPQKISFTDTSFSIYDRTASVAQMVTPIPIKIKIDNGEGKFDSLTFAGQKDTSPENSQSYINVKITPPENLPDDIKAEIGCSLYSLSKEEYEKLESITPEEYEERIAYLNSLTPVSKADPTLLSTNSNSPTEIKLPLDGQTVGLAYFIGFSGNITQSSSATFLPTSYKYTLSMSFSNTTSIKEISGATMMFSDEDAISFNKDISKTENSMLVKCTIDSGTLNLKCEEPAGWKGLSFVPNISISGGLEAANTDFTDAASDEKNYILNKNLTLDGKTYSNEDIRIDGKINVVLYEATITFDDEMQLDIVPSCQIDSVSSAVANLRSVLYDTSKGESKLKYSLEHDLDSSGANVSDYVEYIILNSGTGLSIPYSNTLPSDNDIDVKYDSVFFALDSAASNKNATLKSNEENGSLSFVSDYESTNGEHKIEIATNHIIDLNVEMILPGRNQIEAEYGTDPYYDYYMVLNNVKLGKTYYIEVGKPTITLEWTKAGIKTNKLSQNMNDTIDTGFDMETLTSSLTENLDEDEKDFIKSIKFKENSVNLYLYAVVPELKDESINDGENVLSALNFNGYAVARTIDSDTGIETKHALLIGIEDESGITSEKIIPTTTLPVLDTEENLKNYLVTKELSTAEANGNVDISSLIDMDTKGKLNIEYNISIGGDDNVIEITKTMFDKLKESEESTEIQLEARLTADLNLDIDPIDGTENLQVNLLDLLKDDDKKDETDSDKDLFQRNEATNIDDVQKYLDALEYAEISYTIKNNLLTYSDGHEFNINMDPKIAGINPYKLNVGKGTIKISEDDLEKMLKTYPFEPEILINLPEGNVGILPETSITINGDFKIKTNGTVNLFGGDK